MFYLLSHLDTGTSSRGRVDHIPGTVPKTQYYPFLDINTVTDLDSYGIVQYSNTSGWADSDTVW
jgi:hypothetical protein